MFQSLERRLESMPISRAIGEEIEAKNFLGTTELVPLGVRLLFGPM